MPNHKSAEKRVRQSERRRLINRNNRTKLRTSIKKLRTAERCPASHRRRAAKIAFDGSRKSGEREVRCGSVQSSGFSLRPYQ